MIANLWRARNRPRASMLKSLHTEATRLAPCKTGSKPCPLTRLLRARPDPLPAPRDFLAYETSLGAGRSGWLVLPDRSCMPVSRLSCPGRARERITSPVGEASILEPVDAPLPASPKASPYLSQPVRQVYLQYKPAEIHADTAPPHSLPRQVSLRAQRMRQASNGDTSHIPHPSTRCGLAHPRLASLPLGSRQRRAQPDRAHPDITQGRQGSASVPR